MIRLIKRYGGGSRKLYDTEESRYVSLDEIAAWIRAGQELRVVDSGSDEDVTAQTLAQVIYEDHRKGNAFLPSTLLHDVIRRGSDAIAGSVEQVQATAGRVVRGAVEKLTPTTGMQQELAVLRERLADLEASLGDLEAAPPRRRKGSKRRQARR